MCTPLKPSCLVPFLLALLLSHTLCAQDLAGQGRVLLQFGINARGLADEVRIVGAEHDSRMVWMGEVEALEVFPVEGDEYPALGRGEGQD